MDGLSLFERIEDALESQTIDPHSFEDVGLALLAVTFPRLAPITGGSDDGRDGDIAADEGTIRVLATTAEDVVRNLRDGLASMAAHGKTCDRAIVVTSQPANSHLRDRLREEAKRHDVELVQVYDRKWLAARLLESPDHRQRLIGLVGDPSPLVPSPVVLYRGPHGHLSLRGRDEDRATLTEAANRDVVLVGPSNVGKTRLAASLPRAFFLEGSVFEGVADAVRVSQPETIVVDDADRRPEALETLRRLREEGLAFRIVCTVWPGREMEIVGLLRSPLPLTVSRLERDIIAEMLRETGINNDHLIGDILDQADGRPGWALVLGDLARTGDIDKVLGGEGVVDRIKAYAHRLPERAVLLHVLGAASLLGRMTADDAAVLGNHLGLSRPAAHEALQQLIDGGLLDAEGRSVLAPPHRLRSAIVSAALEGPAWADPITLVESFPQHALDILTSVLDAALRGSGEAEHLFRERLVQHLPEDLFGVDDQLALRLVHLAERTSDPLVVGVRQAIGRVNSWQPPATALDFETFADNRRWSDAIKALLLLARKFGEPEDIDQLVHAALLDGGPTNNTSHPRNELLALAAPKGPFGRFNHVTRTALVDAAARAASISRDARVHELAGEMLGAALAPTASAHWLDPVAGRSVHLVEQAASSAELGQVATEVWPRVVAELDKLTPHGVRAVLDSYADWERLATQATLGMGTPIPDAVGAVARDFVDQGLHEVRSFCAGHNGLAHRWNERAVEYGDFESGDAIPVETGFLALTARQWRPDADDALDRASEELGDTSPTAIGALVARWGQEASDVGLRLGSAGPLLLRVAQSASPTDLLLGMLAIESLTEHVYAVMLESLESEPSRWHEWGPSVVRDDRLRRQVIGAVLERPGAPEAAVTEMLSVLRAEDSSSIEWVVLRRDEPDALCAALLGHPDPDIRGAAALGFSFDEQMHGPRLPSDWQDAWDDAFACVRQEMLEFSGEHRLREIFRSLAPRHPEPFERWLLNALMNRPGEPLSHQSRRLIRHLPAASQEVVLQAAHGKARGLGLVEAVLRSNAGMAEQLLRSGVLDTDEVLSAITNEQRGEWFEAVAEVLVAHGIEPLQVACHLQFGSFMGEESSRMTDLADYCAGLIESPSEAIRSVGAAGESYFREKAEAAAEKERERRIRGGF